MPASARRASTADKLLENAKAFADAIVKAKPTGAKGTYVQKVALSSTMGPGVRVDVGLARPAEQRDTPALDAGRRAGGGSPPNLSETARDRPACRGV